MSLQALSRNRRKGFTLVELAVVIVIIGVLAAFGVPKFLNSVERSKASEAYAYLSAVRNAQERYLAKEGVYADDLTKLDIAMTSPKYFDVGTIATTNSGTNPTWELQLTRIAATSSKGPYTVSFNQDGFIKDNSKSSIMDHDEINPQGSSSSSSSSTSTSGS